MKRATVKYLSHSFLVSCLLLIAHCSIAQWYDPEKIDKKAGDIYAQAYQNGVEEKYTEAINNIKKAIAILFHWHLC